MSILVVVCYSDFHYQRVSCYGCACDSCTLHALMYNAVRTARNLDTDLVQHRFYIEYGFSHSYPIQYCCRLRSLQRPPAAIAVMPQRIAAMPFQKIMYLTATWPRCPFSKSSTGIPKEVIFL